MSFRLALATRLIRSNNPITVFFSFCVLILLWAFAGLLELLTFIQPCPYHISSSFRGGLALWRATFPFLGRVFGSGWGPVRGQLGWFEPLKSCAFIAAIFRINFIARLQEENFFVDRRFWVQRSLLIGLPAKLFFHPPEGTHDPLVLTPPNISLSPQTLEHERHEQYTYLSSFWPSPILLSARMFSSFYYYGLSCFQRDKDVAAAKICFVNVMLAVLFAKA